MKALLANILFFNSIGMSQEIAAIIAVTFISLLSLTGLFLISLNQNFVNRITSLLVSLAAGTLLASALFHLLPESLHLVSEEVNELNIAWLFVVGAVIFFLILEKVLNWHHCHRMDKHEHKKTIAINNLLADGLHNFIDGLIIGAAFSVDTETGLVALLAVALHEIPQEIGDFGILIHSGYSRTKALAYNFVSASVAIAGTIVALSLGDVSNDVLGLMIAFAAGSFLYISLGDLIPEIKETPKLQTGLVHIFMVLVGIVSIFGVAVFVPHEEHHDEEHEEGEDDHEDDEDNHQEEEDDHDEE